ncbi:DUF4263 domain-containing protein [Pseudomonas sp. VS40]|uniref:Shedu immune nuclease family protein n=1 Tax=unclassified Pseudomonas TaxID=196821 RepID=UPI001BDE4156|nr:MULTISPECIES: Shedu immune nuclease family protein [unclassified Pseudomonas]MBT1262763.1 DUF4263 domain-containing protein [Pseudomonas sp. VS40]MBT1274300.1 DUF4263 domain-containing protein [Pseudomonas sp. VS59]
MHLEFHVSDELKQEFVKLLNEAHTEQVYQSFLEKHTQFIPREFVQNHGIHFDLVFRKLHLASDYAPDFFYMSKSSADWNLVLIEIEKPQSKYFKDGTNDLHPDFVLAFNQILQWRAWFENHSNYIGFINGTLGSIREPMGYNSCHVKYVLVHGRRDEFAENAVKRNKIKAMEQHDVKILSYDSLLEALNRKHPLYVCARKNEWVDFLSTKYVSDEVFSYFGPSMIRINDDLRKDIIENKPNWRINSLRGGMELDHVLDKLGRC